MSIHEKPHSGLDTSMRQYPISYNETNLEDAAFTIAEIAQEIKPARRLFHIGTGIKCRFCGQMQIIPDDKLQTFRDFIEAEEYASTHCECADSKTYKEDKAKECRRREERQMTLTEAAYAIEEQFGENTDKPVPENVREAMYRLAEMVFDHDIKSITMSVSSKVKAVVSRTSKDKLIIDRKEQDSSRIEIG